MSLPLHNGEDLTERMQSFDRSRGKECKQLLEQLLALISLRDWINNSLLRAVVCFPSLRASTLFFSWSVFFSFRICSFLQLQRRSRTGEWEACSSLYWSLKLLKGFEHETHTAQLYKWIELYSSEFMKETPVSLKGNCRNEFSFLGFWEGCWED